MNISREGGTDQIEPYADDYPIDAKIEPIASQLNTRNQTSVGEPYISQPYDPDIVTEPVDPPVGDATMVQPSPEDLGKADSERRKHRKEFVEDFSKMRYEEKKRSDPYYGKAPPEPRQTAETTTEASKAAAAQAERDRQTTKA
jgi:hypothetical protein